MRIRTATGLRDRSSEPANGAQAFTIIELLIASTVLLFIVLALVGSNVSGARISNLVQQQTDGQRLERWVTGLIKRDVAEADEVKVGTGVFGALIVPTNGPLVGNKILLHYAPPGVTNREYYVDNGTLWSCDNGSWPPAAVLSGITNAQPFTLVDPASVLGGPAGAQALTNHAGRALLRVWLRLSTLGGKSFFVSPNSAFQGSQIEFFATQRGN